MQDSKTPGTRADPRPLGSPAPSTLHSAPRTLRTLRRRHSLFPPKPSDDLSCGDGRILIAVLLTTLTTPAYLNQSARCSSPVSGCTTTLQSHLAERGLCMLHSMAQPCQIPAPWFRQIRPRCITQQIMLNAGARARRAVAQKRPHGSDNFRPSRLGMLGMHVHWVSRRPAALAQGR